MKKYLLAVLLIITMGSFKVDAYVMATAQYGNIPSHIIMDNRPVIRALQEAMRNSAGGVQAALEYAETQGIGNYEGIIPNLNEGSFSGLDDETEVSASSNAISFSFALSEVIPNASITWTLTYTPQFSESQIDGWICTSNATAQGLGSNFVAPATNEIDPVTQGLGWPYAGCTVA